jgi:hypothetical protein
MKKAKPTTRLAAPVKCPVLPIALRIEELLDANTMAEEREAENHQDASVASGQIDKFRIAMEEMVSFERARSASGALFQLALAIHTAHLLYEQLPPEKNRYIESIYGQLDRLLESVSLLLREKAAPEEYLPVRGIIRFYLDVDGDYIFRSL